MVQLRTVAIFDAGLAGRDAGLSKILPDKLADHRIRHPIFLGGAHDYAGAAFHADCAVPLRLLALAGAHGGRGEDVEVEGHGT